MSLGTRSGSMWGATPRGEHAGKVLNGLGRSRVDLVVTLVVPAPSPAKIAKPDWMIGAAAVSAAAPITGRTARSVRAADLGVGQVETDREVRAVAGPGAGRVQQHLGSTSQVDGVPVVGGVRGAFARVRLGPEVGSA